MASAGVFLARVSQEEINVFLTIDRQLYSILVMELWREPLEMMGVLALWIWLERVGYYNTVKRILSLPNILISELADEAITCLSYLNSNQFSSSCENMDIPLSESIMEKDISLRYFSEKRLVTAQGVTKVFNEVCIMALTDIMEQAIQRNATQSLLDSQMADGQNTTPSFRRPQAQSVPQTEIFFGNVQSYARERAAMPDDRTMFMTFSRGYPVQEQEVREFLTRNYGDCIESFYLQEVEPNEQALYARVTFRSAIAVDLILGGTAKAKFTINGKHVWVRRYTAKHPRSRVPTLHGQPRLKKKRVNSSCFSF